MEAWGLSDTGNVRKQNQDYYNLIHFGPDCLLAIICDGMGGAKSGNVASHLAADAFCAEVRRNIRPDLLVDDVKRIMTDALELANRAVFEHAQLSDAYTGMGTTLVAASVVQMMLRRGEISREQARNHPVRNLITRAVGTEAKVVCDVFTLGVEYGDCILLCSDGLTNLITDPELLFEIAHSADRSACCERLIAMAKDRGAPDNVTAVLISI